MNLKIINEDEDTNNHNAITASNSAAQINFKFKNQLNSKNSYSNQSNKQISLNYIP